MLNMLKIVCTLLCLLFSASLCAGEVPCSDVWELYPSFIFIRNCELSATEISQLSDYTSKQSNVPNVDLYIMEVKMNTENANLLASMLVKNTAFTHVHFYNAQFNNEAIKILSRSSTITDLSLMGNQVQDDDLLTLAKNTSIKSLYLGESNISINAIKEYLKMHPLQALGLFDLKMTDEDFNSIIHTPNMQQLSTLTISIPTVKNLSPLKQLSQLKSLSINDMAINDESAASISLLINLEDLSFYNVDITTNGISNFSTLKNLTYFYFYMGMGSKEGFMLNAMLGDVAANVFSQLPKLNFLELYDLNITNKGAIAVSKNTTLEQVNLANNHIGDEGAIALARSSSIKKLDLSFNEITDVGGIALANQHSLRTLSLDCNLLTDQSAYAFAKNTTLSWLSLRGNNFSDAAIQALKNNSSIEHLFVEFDFDALNGKSLSVSNVAFSLAHKIPSKLQSHSSQ